MEKKQNIVIGGLLAIVLVMAVGYAAFATQLQVGSTASIDSTNSKWDVHFQQNTNNYAITAGYKGNDPAATTTYDSDTAATISTTLKQPGDKVVYTFTVENTGTLNATLTAPTLSVTSKSDLIKYTVSEFSTSSLAKTSGTATFTVTVEYSDAAGDTTVTDANKASSATVTFNANQAD